VLFYEFLCIELKKLGLSTTICTILISPMFGFHVLALKIVQMLQVLKMFLHGALCNIL